MKMVEIKRLRRKLHEVQTQFCTIRDKASREIVKINKEFNFLMKEELKLRAKKPVDWKFLLDATEETTSKYKELHKHLNKFNISTNGMFTTTGQYCIRLYFTKNRDNTYYLAQMIGIRLLHKYLTPIDFVDKSVIYISILDSDCSEHGIPCLLIESDNSKYYFAMTVHGRSSIVKEFSSLEESFDWIRKNRI